MTETRDGWREWFERAWAFREEVVYRDLFGDTGPGIFVLDPSIFVDTFKQESFDPRWLFSGVFESPPNDRHSSWLYVSSGLSNPWEDDAPDPTGVSGLGCELVLESVARGEWAIRRVQHLVAFQTLLACGRYPGRGLLDVHDRIPLRAPITPEPSELTWLFVAEPEGYPASAQLPSGRVDFLHVVGITEAEARLARERGGGELVELLRRAGALPVTDPARACTVARR